MSSHLKHPSLPSVEAAYKALDYKLFTDEYWGQPSAELQSLPQFHHNRHLTSFERGLARGIFRKSIPKALHSNPVDPDYGMHSYALSDEEQLDIDQLEKGTLVLIDQEFIKRDDRNPTNGIKADPSYPVQLANFIDCLPEQLITMTSHRAQPKIGAPDEFRYVPGRVFLTREVQDEQEESHQWYYMREAWYGMVLPYVKNKHVLATFDYRDRTGSVITPNKNAVQLGGDIPARPSVNQSVWTVPRGSTAEFGSSECHRLKTVKVFTSPAELWTQEVEDYRKKWSGLGRIMVRSAND